VGTDITTFWGFCVGIGVGVGAGLFTAVEGSEIFVCTTAVGVTGMAALSVPVVDAAVANTNDIRVTMVPIAIAIFALRLFARALI